VNKNNMDKEQNSSKKFIEKFARREENLAWIELENSIDRTPPKFVQETKRKDPFLSLTAFLP
jgi:hypothetical protein